MPEHLLPTVSEKHAGGRKKKTMFNPNMIPDPWWETVTSTSNHAVRLLVPQDIMLPAGRHRSPTWLSLLFSSAETFSQTVSVSESVSLPSYFGRS